MWAFWQLGSKCREVVKSWPSAKLSAWYCFRQPPDNLQTRYNSKKQEINFPFAFRTAKVPSYPTWSRCTHSSPPSPGILRVTCRRFLASQSTRPKSQAQRRSEFSVWAEKSQRIAKSTLCIFVQSISPGQSAFLQRALSLLQPGCVWVTALKMWKEEFCGRDLKDSPDIFYLACTGSDVVRYEIDEPMALYGAIPMIWAIHRLEGNWSGGWVGGVLLFSFRGYLPCCRWNL